MSTARITGFPASTAEQDLQFVRETLIKCISELRGIDSSELTVHFLSTLPGSSSELQIEIIGSFETKERSDEVAGAVRDVMKPFMESRRKVFSRLKVFCDNRNVRETFGYARYVPTEL